MTVSEKAYAKINLFLDVTGRREDGFHNISSLMHTVSLYDELTVEALPYDNTCIRLFINNDSLANDESNLVYKSALKYLLHFNINADVTITLNKRIPIGAGLGGGSSDAAATLRALNKIYGLATEDELYSISSEIGSDVAFCLRGGISHCSGRGEIVNQLSIKPAFIFVIAIGNERVSTPTAYADLDKKFNNFEDYIPQNDKIYSLSSDTVITQDMLYNVFESVSDIDEITRIKGIMKENCAEATLMSGSGPSVFGIFANSDQAHIACDALRSNGYTAFVAESVYF